MKCRTCTEILLSGAQFCHNCGDTAALLELNDDAKMRYCGKCFSRLQGTLKYCVHCGQASPHAGLGQAENPLWGILQDSRVQFALVGVLAALILIPMANIYFADEPEAPQLGGIAQENTRRRTEPLPNYSTAAWMLEEEDGEDKLRSPAGVAVDSKGNHYISDVFGHRVYKITPAGQRSVYAGTGEPGYSGDGGKAIYARLNHPRGLAVDSWDNLLIADSGNSVVRAVDPRAHEIRSIAGEGPSGIKVRSAGPPEGSNSFLEPVAIYIGRDGEIYVAESPCSIEPEKPSMWVLEPIKEEPNQSHLPRRIDERDAVARLASRR